MAEIEELRRMLDEEGIPYENNIVRMPEDHITSQFARDFYGEACQYRVNQVIYYGKEHSRENPIIWKWDGIWQYGSYGANKGLIESYGPLGTNEDGEPDTVTAKQAFEIIKRDWDGVGS